LIAATSDQSAGASWGCWGTYLGTSATLGTGQANTSLVVNGGGVAGNAACICNELILNGFDDWFLPSKEELNQMYIQRAVIGGFTDNNYWSSTEYGAWDAWGQYFNNGLQYLNTKNSPNLVRAVRAF
jgi:hypothetical protein